MYLDQLSYLIDSIYKIYVEFSNEYYRKLECATFKNIYKFPIDNLKLENIDSKEFQIIHDYMLELNKSLYSRFLLLKDNLKKRYSNDTFSFRIKSIETVYEKINYYQHKQGTYYIGKSLNDLLGVRIILDDYDYPELEFLLSSKQEQFPKFKFITRNLENYQAIHCYFQLGNIFFPWELQIWKSENQKLNMNSHIAHEHKRKNF